MLSRNKLYYNKIKTNFRCHICVNLKSNSLIFLCTVFSKKFSFQPYLVCFFSQKVRQKPHNPNCYTHQIDASQMVEYFNQLTYFNLKELA